jgi:hypothetical protein
MQLKGQQSFLRRLHAVIVDHIHGEMAVQPMLQPLSFRSDDDCIPPVLLQTGVDLVGISG